MPKPPVQRLRQLLNYNRRTGILRWRIARGKMRPGMRAGARCGSYRQVMVDYMQLKEHHVVWAIVTGTWPVGELDHRDRDGLNNRFRNLRRATSSQNKMNCGVRRDNSHGIAGVYLDKRDGRWYARTSVAGRLHNLGRFNTKEEAAEARKAAAHNHYGEFANA